MRSASHGMGGQCDKCKNGGPGVLLVLDDIQLCPKHRDELKKIAMEWIKAGPTKS